jgi:tetratricopeptide (TPR) repeat protein
MGYQLWQTRAQIQRDEGPTTQAFIAEVALELGDHYAARAAADLSEELGAPEDVVNYAICHRVRDRLSLTEDDPQEAERWARSALENALQTDFPDIQANARLELSHVLSRLGRIEEAVGEGQTALVLYEGKGYRLGVRKAQAWLEELKRAPG